MFVGVVLVLALLCYIYFKVNRRDLEKFAKEIPGEKTLPFVGNLYMLRNAKTLTDVLEVIVNITDKYNENGLTRVWLGPTLSIVVWDPLYIEIIANSPHTLDKGPLYELFFGLLSNGVFSSPGGPRWRELRKPLTKSMAKRLMNNEYFEVFVRRSREFRDFIMGSREGVYLDVKRDITALTLEIFGETHLGLDMNEVQYNRWDYNQMVDEFFDLTVTGNLKFSFHIWKLIANFSSLGKEIRRIKERFTTFLMWILEERKKCEEAKRGNLEYYTDFLLRRAYEKNVPEEILCKELADVIIAGADTSGVALSSALLFLAMFPEYQEKAYREQVSIFGSSERDPTLEDLLSMSYLERVWKETIRIVTPLGIVKTCDHNLTAGKYTIPKGSMVYLFVYRLHRDPKYWDRPDSFYPDHFLPQKDAERPRFAYVPFGVGPRMCPGFQYSTYSSMAVLSRLLRSFRMRTQQRPEDVIYDYKLMLSMRTGYRLMFEKR